MVGSGWVVGFDISHAQAESQLDCEQWVARIQHYILPRSVSMFINPLHDPQSPLPPLQLPQQHPQPQQQQQPQSGV